MRYSILYVDDEPANLSSLTAFLRRDYQMYTAESGAAALDILRETSIDLIISDQRMPQMTGVELLEKVRLEHPEIIRMVLTGYSDLQAIVDAINKGHVYYYITKPWKGEEIKVVLSNALEAYALRQKNRQLEKKNILAQFEILKNQINPHFLFNCMNILSSLIPTQPDEAVRFTNRFAKLYRSLLQLREQLLITLEEELSFTRSYIELQQIRFRDKLSVQLSIAEDHLQGSLPPFALQTLLENAIKHNVISAEQPLQIDITAKEGDVWVRNPLQKRKNVKYSTGTGLANLRHRYAIITDQPIIIEEDGGYFLVKLPLIPAE